MKRSYLSKKRTIQLCIALFLIMIINFPLFLLCLALLLGFLAIYRKKTLEGKRVVDPDLKSIFSPVSGVVKDISEDEYGKKITFNTNLWGPLGVYMPFFGSIDSQEHELLLYNSLGNKVVVKYASGYLLKSSFWIKAGDLARFAANIGFLGFGASIELILEKDSKILVDKKQRVYAGQSIIAGLEVHNE